jgi:hydroxyethylthiazole kinase
MRSDGHRRAPGAGGSSTTDLVERAASALQALRDRRPRVHCITNTVSQPIVANGLLSLGAVPSLTSSLDEVADFAARADALVINLGTLEADRRDAIRIAMDAARGAGRPVVLDPVFVEVSPRRLAFARELLALQPALVRLNRGELDGLAGEKAADPGGFAQAQGTVVALTGAEDLVHDGSRVARSAHGHHLLATVTASGCLASAMAGAFLTVSDTPFEAAVAALLTLAIAGERAGGRTEGPGSFAAALLDELYGLRPAHLLSGARLS